MTNTTLRDRILTRDDLPRAKVVIPEWDGEEVHVRAMTAGEVESFGRDAGDPKTLLNFMARLLVKVVVDEVGDRIFGDDDADALAEKNAGALKKLFDAAQGISGLEDDHTGN